MGRGMKQKGRGDGDRRAVRWGYLLDAGGSQLRLSAKMRNGQTRANIFIPSSTRLLAQRAFCISPRPIPQCSHAQSTRYVLSQRKTAANRCHRPRANSTRVMPTPTRRKREFASAAISDRLMCEDPKICPNRLHNIQHL